MMNRGALSEKSPAEEPPQAWLVRLAELKKQGRLKEFSDGLAEFRKRYPGYAIPRRWTGPSPSSLFCARRNPRCG